MSKKIVFIADFFADQVSGGGELNNEEAINILIARGYSVERKMSQQVTEEYLKSNNTSHFVVANFIGLEDRCKKRLAKDNYKYIIYEHDHKYLKTRDPSHFSDYVAPPDQIINRDFYEKSLAVFCQSNLHKEVAQKNLKIDNIHSLGGNLWSKEILSHLRSLSKKTKQQKYSIWNSFNPIKSTPETVAYCRSNNIPYDLVGNLPYDIFLEKLSNNDTFIFIPKTLETLCRVIVEARMCGMKVLTNNKVGATSEEWFSLKGEDLIDCMIKKRKEIVDKIEDALF